MTTTAEMAGSPIAALSGKPLTHLIPSRSPVSPPLADPRRYAGIACANDPSCRGCTPIFAGSSASRPSATIVRSASSRRSSMGGIAARTSAAVR